MVKIEYWPAVFLALCFGYFSIQEFYLRNIFRGILGVLFSWTFIPLIVSLIQACVWLFKGKEWFESKYNNIVKPPKQLLS